MLIFSVDSFSPFPENVTVVLSNYPSGWTFNEWERASPYELYYFITHIGCSFISYCVGYMACTTCMQIGAFALPLVLTIVLSSVLFMIKNVCESLLIRIGSSEDVKTCIVESTEHSYLRCLVIAVIALSAAQIIFTSSVIWTNGKLLKLKEDQLFRLPMYTPVLLEQWLMLNRRNELTDTDYNNLVKNGQKAKVIICTTMFREDEHEMRQLIESLQGVLQSKNNKYYECHIVFDDAVNGTELTEYAYQLVYLLEEVFEKTIQNDECKKIKTPYGMCLEYKLKNTPGGGDEMDLTIHLKDNSKVKKKKRWSQIMYMSYVLDQRLKDANLKGDGEVFILTTDADVQFTSGSIAYLLDLMTRDESVGAVCARTFPLGSGPVVWYQVFEYAIGHWFQKAAEHVIGSVLCSPGCFSVYRCKAVQDVLKTYASEVEHGFDFLTKDMGEDRWFCTLMVQTGWRIEYCAASENSTHCPETFDEFFKQRRRWVVSTLANMMLLLQQWTLVHENNHRVSFLFLVYQALLLFATLIGPSSVILIICGGLKYAWNWNPIVTLILQLTICIGFTAICLVTSSKTQLNAAKILTFFYATVMTAVTVGTALQVAYDIRTEPGVEPNFISDDIKMSTTTVFLAMVTGIFLITALLHLQESVYLLHGIWYILCLPAGYLLLTIYSLCNITDRSWGTRDIKNSSDPSTISTRLLHQLGTLFGSIFRCCVTEPAANNPNGGNDKKAPFISDDDNDDDHEPDESASSKNLLETTTTHKQSRDERSDVYLDGDDDEPNNTTARKENVYPLDINVIETEPNEDHEERPSQDFVAEGRLQSIKDVKEWLPDNMKSKYSQTFIENGFENTLFISSMTDKDLFKIGIKADGERRRLLSEIQKLPAYEIPPGIPVELHKWLNSIGLKQYVNKFRKAFRDPNEVLEGALNSFQKKDIKTVLQIEKRGHINRLLYAIKQMRNPTQREKKIERARNTFSKISGTTIDGSLKEFWDELIKHCLAPLSYDFVSENALKENLSELRNAWLTIFGLSNILWLILIFTLSAEGHLLSVFGSNPVGFVVVLLFGFIVIVQFLAMVLHRFSTLKHFLARAPYLSGHNVVYDLGKSNDTTDLKTCV